MAVAGGLALLVTVTLTGHAVSGDLVPLAVVTDLVHLAGVSVWLGGLALLVAAVLWVPGGAGGDEGGDDADEPLDDRVAVVDRFSQVAFGAVVAIVVSGVVQGWRQVGGYDALTETTYGRLLVVKVLLVAAMLVAAAFSRSWVRQRAGARGARLALSPGPGAVAASSGGGPSRLQVLRWSVAAEVGIAVLVLAVTALLVNAVPGETASGGGGGPLDTQVTEDDIVLTLDVDSTTVGSTGLHLYLNTPNGFPVTAEEVTATLTLPEQDLGPIDVPLVDFGQGHWSAESAEFPLPGEWELELLVAHQRHRPDPLLRDHPRVVTGPPVPDT